MPKISFMNAAGALAVDAVPTCKPEDTAGVIRTFVENNAHSFVSIDYVYVLVEHELVGVFSLHELMTETPSTLVSHFMTTKVASVHALTDRKHVAELALAESIKAVPVLDQDNKFMGVVTADVVMQIFNEEHTSYLFKTTGITKRQGTSYRELSFWGQFRTRSPWLVLGLFGGLAGAMVVNFFEHSISDQLFVAAFIPAIVYIADAIGNQTEMLVVRALGRNKPFVLRTYLFREWATGLLLSVFLGLIMYALSFAWLKDSALSVVLGISIIATTLFSITFTVLLPWFLKRLSFDPAVASGPLATVICDVASVTIYLLIATSFL